MMADSAVHYLKRAERIVDIISTDVSFYRFNLYKSFSEAYLSKGDVNKSIFYTNKRIEFVENKDLNKLPEYYINLHLQDLMSNYNLSAIHGISDLSTQIENKILYVLGSLPKEKAQTPFVQIYLADFSNMYLKLSSNPSQELLHGVYELYLSQIESNPKVANSKARFMADYIASPHYKFPKTFETLTANVESVKQFIDRSEISKQDELTILKKLEVYLGHGAYTFKQYEKAIKHYEASLATNNKLDFEYQNDSYYNNNNIIRVKIIQSDYHSGKTKEATNRLYQHLKNSIIEAPTNDLQQAQKEFYSEVKSHIQTLTNWYLATNTTPPNEFYDMLLGHISAEREQQRLNSIKLNSLLYYKEKGNTSSSEIDYFLNLGENDLSLNVAKCQAQINDNEAVVKIIQANFETSKKYAALLITKRGVPQLINLGEANQLQRNYEKYFTTIGSGFGDRGTEGCYTDFWQRIDKQLDNITKIYLIGTGIYDMINPDFFTDSKGKYIIDKYAVSRIESLHALTNEPYSYPIRTNEVVLYGNPQFSQSKQNSKFGALDFVAQNRGSEQSYWIALPNTEKEVNAINQSISSNLTYDVTLVTGANSTESNVRKIRNPEMLHIATHGFIDTTLTAYNNGLVFTGANDISELDVSSTDDGYLFAEDISTLNLAGTKLVTLSACQTGLFKQDNNSLNFRTAFFDAGAENILVSLWQIDDKATQELMTEFYNNLSQTNRIRYSFEMAQKYMKEKYPSPYYWGSFILISSNKDTNLN